MRLIIDAHQDIAYNALTFGRDIRRSVEETRRLEVNGPVPSRNGMTMLGWPDFQKAGVGLIFATLFIVPRRYQAGAWDQVVYETSAEAHTLWRAQLDYYRRLCDESPDKFRLVTNQSELAQVLLPWVADQPAPAGPAPSRPVGLVLSMEGAEGLASAQEIVEYYEAGLRFTGPVWSGIRLCGGMYEPGGFTREGVELLKVMEDLKMGLDISHMNERSALEALERYDGVVLASHANTRVVLRDPSNERHLTDRQIQLLIEKDGVIGVLPFARFLKKDWSPTDDPSQITLADLIAHIDHICQIAGDARHAALGTDMDGGWGWPHTAADLPSIAALPRLGTLLEERGYSPADIDAIMGGNWRRILERTLPAS